MKYIDNREDIKITQTRNWWKQYKNKEILKELCLILEVTLEQLGKYKDASRVQIPKSKYINKNLDIYDVVNFLDKFSYDNLRPVAYPKNLPYIITRKHPEYEGAQNLESIYLNHLLFTLVNKDIEQIINDHNAENRDDLITILNHWGFTQNDLLNYICLLVHDPDRIISRLKNVKKQIEKRVIDKNDKVEVRSIDYEWLPNVKEHKGELIIKGEDPISFGGGNFGGINELISNFNHYISSERLKQSIFDHLQQNTKRSPSEISLSQWKYDLKRYRGILFKYFNIESTPENNPTQYRMSFFIT